MLKKKRKKVLLILINILLVGCIDDHKSWEEYKAKKNCELYLRLEQKKEIYRCRDNAYFHNEMGVFGLNSELAYQCNNQQVLILKSTYQPFFLLPTQFTFTCENQAGAN